MANITIQIEEDWVGNYDGLLEGHDVTFGQDFSEADVVIAGTDPVTFDQLEQAGNLIGIVRLGAGCDNVPQDICKDLGITCAYTPNGPSRSVAEIALGMILCAERGIGQQKWGRYLGREMQSLTLGVVGVGRIGKRFISLAKPMFGQILACDPVSDTTFDEIHHVARMPINDLLRLCDVVTLHIPLTGNQDAISTAELAGMRPDSTLVNTSRGGIVDEVAMIAHLLTQPEFKFCCDTFVKEPYDGEMRGKPGFVMTSHMGSMTHSSRDRMEKQAIEAVLAILNKKKPQWLMEG
jgi:D-3-phosphoglycerate dehydrogenase